MNSDDDETGGIVFGDEYGPSQTNTSPDQDAFVRWGVEGEWTEKKFLENFSIEVINMSDDESTPYTDEAKDLIGPERGHESRIEVDIKGIDPGLANALRRILIAEVPTVALDVVHIFQNTSIFCDEILVHRIGLIPIRADPDKLGWGDIALAEEDCSYKPIQKPKDLDLSNSLVFNLKVKCSLNPKAMPQEKDEKVKYIDSVITSKYLTWIPQGDQAKRFGDAPPKPLYDDIVIAKLRPGQEIELELFAIKGMGKIHTKWSAVCPAWYRLMPKIQFLELKTLPREWLRGKNSQDEPEGSTFGKKTFVLVKPPGKKDFVLGNIEKTYDRADMEKLGANDLYPTVDVSYPGSEKKKVLKNVKLNSSMLKPVTQIWDDNARRLKKMCPRNVFDIEEAYGHCRPVVARPRDCTMCRECTRHPGWRLRVKLGRERDHYIFKIASVGQYKARDLLKRTVKILRGKVSNLRKELGALREIEKRG